MRWLAWLQIFAFVLAGCGGGGGGSSGSPSSTRTVTGTPPAGTQLLAITVTPASATIAKLTTVQLKAIGSYSDGTSADLTQSVAWQSATGAVATVSNSGLVSGISAGTAVISATSAAVSGAATITITGATVQGLSLTPQLSSIPVGASAQFTGTASLSDGTSQDVTSAMQWSSTDATVASVNTGLVTALKPGTAQISAALNGQSVSVNIVVPDTAKVSLESIIVAPAQTSLAVGQRQQFTATGAFSDGSSYELTGQVTWSSSNSGIATIDNTGLAAALQPGSSTITAALNGVSGSAGLTVTTAVLQGITVTPANASMPVGLTQQFVATGAYSDGTTADITRSVTWSSDSLTAAIVEANGLATALAAGSANITAKSGTISASAAFAVSSASLVSISVTPDSASIPVGNTQQYAAMGAYSDGTTEDLSGLVVWQSDATAVAPISQDGLAVGLAQGGANITATLGSVSGTTPLTVTSAAVTSIYVTPASVSVPLGLSRQFNAYAIYTDGTSADITALAEWSSDAQLVAIVPPGGLATAVGKGVANITASYGAFNATAPMTVTDAALSSIAITPTPVSVPAGMTQQLSAKGIYTDGSTFDLTGAVTWSSGDNTVAQVSDAGLVTGVAAGQIGVTATLGTVSSTVNVTVTAALLQSITLSPNPLSLPIGFTQQFVAYGNYSDKSVYDITSRVKWTSGSNMVATITAGGLVTGMTKGSVQIKASLGAISGSASVTVTGAALSSIEITPISATVAVHGTQQFTAIGHYVGGGTLDITSAVKWSSSSNTVATIYNGVATGVGPGTTNINASIKKVKSLTPGVLTVTR